MNFSVTCEAKDEISSSLKLHLDEKFNMRNSNLIQFIGAVA